MDQTARERPANEVWRVLERRILFCHQSVGQNILDGLVMIEREQGLPESVWQLIEEDGTAAQGHEQRLLHARVGKNGDPKSKLEAFRTVLESGRAGRPELAMLKLCYVDFVPKTNVRALFDLYLATIAALEEQLPESCFMHVTVPLTVVKRGMKTQAKRLLGRTVRGDVVNLRREEYNALLRAEFPADAIFDLAAVESTHPDGHREAFFRDLALHAALAPVYATKDGGHLNELGSKTAAAAMIVAMAGLLQHRAEAAASPA